MKNLLLKLFLFTALICAIGADKANAQNFRDARVKFGTSIPVSCIGTRGDSLFVVQSGANEGLYTCVAGTYVKAGTGGAGASSLSTLNDTFFSGILSGQFLKYNGTKWINSSVATVDVIGLSSSLSTKQDTSGRGQPSGYASLGVDGLVPSSQLPAVSGGGGGGTFATNRNVEVNAGAAGYTTLAEAITTIGANNVTLNINSPVSCSTAITTHKNTTIEFTANGQINSALGCNLTVLSRIDAGKKLIFNGFAKSNLRVHSDVDFIYPEWFGARGEAGLTTFDDFPAVQLMFDTTHYTNVRGDQVGFHYKFGAKGYYFSQTLNVRRASYIEGSGSAGLASSTILFFPVNKKGIVFQSSATESDGAGGFVSGNTASHMSKISNLKIFAQGESTDALTGTWTPTHNLTLSGQGITRVSGEVMDRGFGYGVGTTVTIGRANWIIEDSGAGTVAATLRPYRSMGCGDPKPVDGTVCQVVAGVKTDIIHNVNGVMDNSWIGMKVRLVKNPTVEYKIIAIPNNFNNSNPASQDIPDIFYFQIGNLDGTLLTEVQKPADFMGDIEIFGFDPANVINTNRPVRVNTFHAIDARAQIWVENVRIRGFNGNGINFDSGLVAGFGQTGYQPNNNNSNVTRNFIYNVAGNGTYARGVNSNQITFTGNDVSNTKGAGFFDVSFLGNGYYNNHTSGTSGISYQSEGGVNGSTFVGNYQEGESPCNKLNQYGMWFSGNACFSSDSQGVVLGAGGAGSLRINKLSMVDTTNGQRYYLQMTNGVLTSTAY